MERHGWYSKKFADRWGTIRCLMADGREALITYYNHEAEKPFGADDDVEYVGVVHTLKMEDVSALLQRVIAGLEDD